MADLAAWSPPEPRELPALRASLTNQMSSTHEHHALAQLLSQGWGTLSPHTGDVGRDAAILLAEEHHRLATAELYYVSSEMTRLAQAAAETLSLSSFHPDDLPSSAGLMVFAEPIGGYESTGKLPPATDLPISIVAVSWGPNGLIPADRGIWITLWSATHYEAEVRTLQTHGRLSEQQAWRHVHALRAPLTWDNEAVISYHSTRWGIFSNENGPQPEVDAALDADTNWDDISGTTIAWTQVVRAAWLLMTQEGIAQVSEEALPRAARRRAHRDGYSPAPVRIVRIRHHEAAPVPSDEASSHRSYRVRWTVRGHWRRQWYSSRNEHRPVWIQPYIKGPSDAPLDTTDTVHLLDR